MRKFMSLMVLLCTLGILAACGGAAQPEVPPQVVTQVVEKVVTSVTEVEKLVTQVTEVEKEVIVTATPEPGAKTLRMVSGVGDIPTLDPALSEDSSSIQIVEMAYIGLTTQNEETAETIPGMAESWDISEDGTTYTFNLRQDVPWVRFNAQTGAVEQVVDAEGNGRVVTCADFKYGIMRSLNPETASPYAYILSSIVGSEEYNTADTSALSPEELQALADGVGITCSEDNTQMEIQIKEPASYFPAIAGLWVARAQPQWVIEERGDRWTEPGFFQSYGPYTLQDWNHESDLTLVANPLWPATDEIPQPKITNIYFTMVDETPAFAAYETGDLDVVAVPLPELDRVKADATLSAELTIAPVLCTYYYGYNVTKPPFDDANVRKAFSWAIDRTAIVENVTKGGQEPARWFSRPGLAAAPTMENADFGPPVTADPEAAKEFLAASKYGGVEGLPPISLVMNQSEGHIRIGEAIQQMWKENLGVDVQLTTQEWKVFLETLDQDAPQIFRLGWCADYPDANNFARDVFSSKSGQNNTNWTNEEFDRLVDEAAIESDVETRVELYTQAEKILVEDDAAIIPIYWYTRVGLTKPYVERTFSVLGGGKEALYKWDITSQP